MKPRGLIFTRLEKFFKCKYPFFLKEILIETGFNSSAALRIISESSIETIEQYINDNLDQIKHYFAETLYLSENGNFKKSPFKFLIGHKSLILNIKKDLNEYLLKKKTKKTEISSEIPSTEQLKISFKNKVKNYIEQKKINVDLEKIVVSNFSFLNNRAKCFGQCPFCVKKIACYFDTCWRTSNFFKHILICLKKNTLLNNPPSNPPIVQRAISGILQQVENLPKVIQKYLINPIYFNFIFYELSNCISKNIDYHQYFSLNFFSLIFSVNIT